MKRQICLLLALLLFALSLSGCAARRSSEVIYPFDDTKKNIGLFLDDPMDMLKLEEQPEIYGWFEHWHGREADNKLMFCRSHPNFTPFITWMPTDYPLKEIASGQQDTYIRTFLERLARVCPQQDILIRFAHEMELRPNYGAGWYNWQYKGSAEDYKAAWIRVVTIGREVCPNAKWIWAPNRADKYAEPFYPGDEYVDYVGVTLNSASDKRFSYMYFEDFYKLEATKENLEKYGKKIIICEASYSCDDMDAKAAYLATIFDYFKTDPQIAAIVFFNEDKAYNRMFNFTDNEDCMRVFIEGLRGLHNEEG